MFKTETHLHTFPVSSCSRLTPEEIIRLYHEAGYTTVFVSDHFAKYHFDRLPGAENLSWKEKTSMICDAYKTAKEIGESLGMHVLFSPELSVAGNHYLLYGVDKAFLDLREDIFTLEIAEFREIAKAHGITMIEAHPYRDDKYFPTPEYVDGIEVINANPRHENYDDKAFELAKQYNLPMTAGSDAHKPEDIGLAAMLSEEPIVSAEQYLSLLNQGKLRLWRKGEEV